MSFEQVCPLHVIILNHNNYDVIKPLYESIVKENKAYPKYLYFIDNGSGEEDGSREFLRTICRNNPLIVTLNYQLMSELQRVGMLDYDILWSLSQKLDLFVF